MKTVIDIPEYIDLRNYNIPYDILNIITNGTLLVDVLDKLRTEIDRQEKWLLQAGYTAYNVDIAFDAIKSALAESEG